MAQTSSEAILQWLNRTSFCTGSGTSFSFHSLVKITGAAKDVYAAIIDGKVAMKIGPGQYEPPSGPQRWSLTLEGRDYKIWEASL